MVSFQVVKKKRAALAKTLLRPADILILDEPTNHLDTKMADWLEDYLRRYRGAMIMVTHDRYFLDQVTNRITELDHASYIHTRQIIRAICKKRQNESKMKILQQQNGRICYELSWNG